MENGKWGPFVSHVLYGGGGLGGAPLEHQKQRASIIHISTGSEPLIWPDALSGSDERRDLLRLTALLNHDVPLHRSKARHPEHPSWQENYLGCSSKSSRDPLNYSEDALVLFTHLTLHLDDRRQRWQCSLSRVISGPRYLPIRKICILAFIDLAFGRWAIQESYEDPLQLCCKGPSEMSPFPGGGHSTGR